MSASPTARMMSCCTQFPARNLERDLSVSFADTLRAESHWGEGLFVGKKLGAVLVGLGVLLLTLGLLSRFYAYGKLAVVPMNQKSVSYSAAHDATVFSIPDKRAITTDLLTTVNVVGDVNASKEISDKLGRQIVVWEKTTYTDKPDYNADSGQPPLSGSHDRIAFDARTGEAVQCCGTYSADSADAESGKENRDADVRFDGLLVKFPFDTQKKTYRYFDSTLAKAVPMAYKGTEKLYGTTTYKFVADIPDSDNGTLDAPASYFGVNQAGDITLDKHYSNVRTYWIEPETGAIVKSEEKPNQYVTYQGNKVGVLTQLTSVFPDKDVKKNAADYGSKATELKIVHTWLPLVGIVLGLILLILGLGLTLLGGRRRTAA